MTGYVEKFDGKYRVGGTRVSLDSIVYAFLRGASAESIQRSFPAVTLEAVYGAIAFYLANQEAVDIYLAAGDAEFDALQKSSRSLHREWHARLKGSVVS